jgi:hypothetical protein
LTLVKRSKAATIEHLTSRVLSMKLFARFLFGVVLIAVIALGYVRIRHSLGWFEIGPGDVSSASSDTVPAAQAGEGSAHPIDAALELAEKVQRNIDDNVHDYTASVIKQERSGSELKPEELCEVKVRNKPFSVYMKFLAPDNLKGQEVIYVEGANDGKLIGHAGSGAAALLGSKWLDPRGPIAMFEQRYPITELGIGNLTKRLIEIGQHDRQYGECYVWRNDNAMVGDRPCISITVMHPVRRSGFIFHIARIFIDKELMVPLHYEAYDWPQQPGEAPSLLERYTYTNLKLNPGLTDADFDPHNPNYNFGLK